MTSNQHSPETDETTGVDQTTAQQDVDNAFEGGIDDAAQEQPAPPTNDQRVIEAEREVLRAKAELENFRKRMQRDTEQQLKYANTSLVRDLLDIVDNLNRAVEASQGDAANSEALRSGVELVSKQFATIIGKYGCKPINAVGQEFDPNLHEAIAQMPSQEYASGKVAQEVAVGYVLHDRVVRPSSVIVSTGPAK